MSDKAPGELRDDLESLGWKCQEIGSDGDWSVAVRKDDEAVVATGCERQLVWNAAYREAIRRSAEQSE